MEKKCDGNVPLARDLLLLSKDGSELYQRAARVHADRKNPVQTL
jgi:hypothetical protein